MSEPRRISKNDEAALLSQTAPGTEMGNLLRQYWHPVALSRDIASGKAKPLRIMSEELTLYRGHSGRAYLIGGRCAHRLTVLHTGWVEHDELRCIYHGWKYDGTGQCTEMPAEKDDLPATVRIAGYPVHEYGGLVFAFMGEGEAPAFDLPRKDVFEQPDDHIMLFSREQTWPTHWLAHVENSMDAAHVSFVHQMGKIGPFGEAVTTAIPDLTYEETDAGIRQTATRATGNVRVSDWTFPNNNHILIPLFDRNLPWCDLGVWMVPRDDESTARFQLYAIRRIDPDTDRQIVRHYEEYGAYDPSHHHDELMYEGKYPEEPLLELTNAQDYVAIVGQGLIADRVNERLGKTDAGIAMLRRIFQREMAAMRAGRPTKNWTKLAHAVELPRQGAVAEA
jgi:5,5'-dehydrodivanillate O-demethylase